MAHSCLVCAYPKLKSPPRSPSGGGSYEICPSCGFQYGVDDDDRGITPHEWRRTWIANGARWSSVGIKPTADWTFENIAVRAASASKSTSKTAAAAKSKPSAKDAKTAKTNTKSSSAKKAVKKPLARKKSS